MLGNRKSGGVDYQRLPIFFDVERKKWDDLFC